MGIARKIAATANYLVNPCMLSSLLVQYALEWRIFAGIGDILFTISTPAAIRWPI